MLTYTGSDEATRADLVHQVLQHGLEWVLATGVVAASDDATNAMVDPADRWTCEYDLILASGLFEEFGYVRHYPEHAWAFCGHREGLRHFVRYGWRMLLNPHAGLRPLVLLVHLPRPRGRAGQPLRPLPGGGATPWSRHGARRAPMHAPPPPAPARWPAAGVPVRRVRRGRDRRRHGGAYLRELSRFADVYYLADCEMEAGELDKLAPYTRGRWAIRHGRYDFGSYSMLARDLVGWDVLETYDEMLLANDSCYLVRPFDEVFDRMDAAAGRTGGDCRPPTTTSRPASCERLGRRLARRRRASRPDARLDLWRMTDFIHVGSYFLALPLARSSTTRSSGGGSTRSSPSPTRTPIIRKYEIGISQLPDPWPATTWRPSSTASCPSTRSTASRRSTC